MEIRNIQNAIRSNKIRISTHAKEEMLNDNFDVDDILYSVTSDGEIIEDYPEDRISPSCLIYGHVYDSRPAHSVWGYILKREIAICVTAYYPRPEKWIDNRIRRKRE